jgi:hypothetical protein
MRNTRRKEKEESCAEKERDSVRTKNILKKQLEHYAHIRENKLTENSFNLKEAGVRKNKTKKLDEHVQHIFFSF